MLNFPKIHSNVFVFVTLSLKIAQIINGKLSKTFQPGTKREKLEAEGRPEIGATDQSAPEALQCPSSKPHPVTSACQDRDPSPGGN